MIDYGTRVQKVQQKMAKNNIDIFVATRLGTLSYLGGCFAPFRNAIVVSAGDTKDDVEFIVPAYDYGRLREETWIGRVEYWQNGSADRRFVDVLTRSLRERDLTGSSTIGLEMGLSRALGLLLASELEILRENFPGHQLVDVTPLVESILVVKETEEIELIRKASEITDIGFKAGVENIEEGKTECQVAGAAELAMRNAGNEWLWSLSGNTEVGSGYRTQYYRCNVSPPTRKKIKKGEWVKLDVHATYNQYMSDLMFPVFFGDRPSAEETALFDLGLQITNDTLSGIRPDVMAADLARKAKAEITRAGFGEFYNPYLSHGLGTCTQLPPMISEDSEDRLEENMTLVLNVHIAKPGLTGFTLELPVLVTKDRGVSLSKIPIELTCV